MTNSELATPGRELPSTSTIVYCCGAVARSTVSSLVAPCCVRMSGEDLEGCVSHNQKEGRWKKEDGRRKKEEGRREKGEGRRKKLK